MAPKLHLGLHHDGSRCLHHRLSHGGLVILGIVFIAGLLLGAGAIWLIITTSRSTDNRVTDEWIEEHRYDKSGY